MKGLPSRYCDRLRQEKLDTNGKHTSKDKDAEAGKEAVGDDASVTHLGLSHSPAT